MIRVESISVCIGYGDILAHTLPENLPLIDRMVIVTAPDDDETISVCRRHSVHYVLTEDHKRGGPFNKARLIQRAFDQIGGQDWIVHLDSDIILPAKFRQYCDWAHLQESTIYGADRCDVVGYDAWMALRRHAGRWDNHAHECGHWWHPTFSPGSRWISSLHGFAPIGAFQLFHGSAMVDGGYHVRKYPTTHGDAARTDMQFALQWDRKHRAILPEVIVLHLESEKTDLGANWGGRTTKRFGPEPAATMASMSPRPVS